MVGNATEEGVLSKLDHPSQGDPLRTIALLFLVAWLGGAFILTAFGLTLTLALFVALFPVALVFLIVRQVRGIRQSNQRAAQARNGEDPIP